MRWYLRPNDEINNRKYSVGSLCRRFWPIALAGVLTIGEILFGCTAPRPNLPITKTATPSHAEHVATSATPSQNSVFASPVAAENRSRVHEDGSRLLSQQEANGYLGDQACAACHADICRDYATTRHAVTLKKVTVQEQGAYFRAGGKLVDPELGYAYHAAVENGKCVMIGESAKKRGVLAADYVVGTGRNAYTYFHAERPDSWVDLRISYYTGKKRWDFTPAQHPGDRHFERAAGVVQAGENLSACLQCHVTYLRAGEQGLDIANSRLGIGCERCHGPGRVHVEALQQSRGKDRPYLRVMEDFHKATPARITQLCGVCHHNQDNSPAGAFSTENGLARFQGVALARSRCFQESKSLSCITCHSPHQNVVTEARQNNALCVRCHASTASDHSLATQTEPVAPSAQGKACPVNPRTGCIDCHMPKQTISTIPFARYRNHWIKVWK